MFDFKTQIMTSSMSETGVASTFRVSWVTQTYNQLLTIGFQYLRKPMKNTQILNLVLLSTN